LSGEDTGHPTHIGRMSTQNIVRAHANDGTGHRPGTFAKHAAAVATDVELTPEAKQLPEWSEDELEVDLADGLHAWTQTLREGRSSQTTSMELLGVRDKAAMVEAYGHERAEYLRGLTFRATAETRLAWQGNQCEPDEYTRSGRLTVHSGGKKVMDIDFAEDGPDISGKLLSAAPETRAPHAYTAA